VERYSTICVIIIDPEGKKLDPEILRLAVERNPDGWGIGWLFDGKLNVTRGFGIKGAKRAWSSADGLRRVFHARVGTHGNKDIHNCHPFDADHNGERRLFFHNGTVGIPRFNTHMSDSWHLSQYVKSFPTTKEFTADLNTYAFRENSRFVLMTVNTLQWMGRGWLQRDGVFYSNGSCLCGSQQVWQGGRRFEGGLMGPDAELEVTSPDHFGTAGYDAERKLYSNKVKAVSYTAKDWDRSGTSNRGHGPERWDHKLGKFVPYEPLLNPALRAALKPLETDDEGKSTTHHGRQDVWDHKEEERKAEARKLSNQRFKNAIIEGLMKAPWMNNTRGVKGLKKSWPKTTNFISLVYNFGNNITYRVQHEIGTDPRSRMWREVVFKGGQFVQSDAMYETPYVDGVVIEMHSNKVMFGDVEMSFKDWQDLIIEDALRFFMQGGEEDDNTAPFGEKEEMLTEEEKAEVARLIEAQRPVVKSAEKNDAKPDNEIGSGRTSTADDAGFRRQLHLVDTDLLPHIHVRFEGGRETVHVDETS